MRGNPGTAVLWAGGGSWDEQGYEQQGAVVGDTCAPCFSTQHPPMMQPASNLFRKALLHKEKCSAGEGALGQSTALAAAWAQRLTPAHQALVAFWVQPVGCLWVSAAGVWSCDGKGLYT